MVTTGTDTNLRLVTPTAFPQQAAAQRAIKRGFDLVVALLAIACLSPLFALIALWIKLDSRGPVFFRQVRVGRNGLHFRIFKFRTMVADADQRGAQLTIGADQRITRSGRFLRGYKFDELPQFINVLRGEMSMIGPRPERRQFVQQLSEVLPYYSQRHLVKPGVTGWAQVCYPYGASVEDARMKHQYDLYYIKNQSPLLDAVILFETLRVVFFGRLGR